MNVFNLRPSILMSRILVFRQQSLPMSGVDIVEAKCGDMFYLSGSFRYSKCTYIHYTVIKSSQIFYSYEHKYKISISGYRPSWFQIWKLFLSYWISSHRMLKYLHTFFVLFTLLIIKDIFALPICIPDMYS